jgi:hypothetical protein
MFDPLTKEGIEMAGEFFLPCFFILKLKEKEVWLTTILFLQFPNEARIMNIPT